MKTMKKTFTYIAMIAIAGTVLVGCRSAQPVQTQAQPSVEDQIREMEAQRRLLEAQTDLRLAQQEADLRLAQGREVRSTLIWVPCMQYGTGLSDDMMFGVGIGDGGQRTQANALLAANRVAVADIASRFIGVLQTSMEEYMNQGHTQSGRRIDQTEIEAMARNVGESVINRQAQVVCREIAVDRNNMYIGHVAIAVPLRETVNEVQQELERAGLRFDRERFRNQMINDIEGQNRQRREEIEALDAARRR